jgi:monoamine oxidase
MAKASFDVLIVGAGAAGLAAAVELARAGRSALVLEARDRVGGRCWSRHVPGIPVPVELGAEFIHGRPAATLSLLQQAGTAAVDTPRNPWIIQGGRLEPRDNFFEEIQTAMRASRMPGTRDMSFDAFLARELRPRISEKALAFARMLAEGYDAADPARASARAIIEEWTNEGAGAALLRPLGGYDRVLAYLAEALTRSTVRLRLQTIVRAVQWKRGSVAIEATSFGKAFHATAPRAIITLPVGVLQVPNSMPGAVCFTPALKEKRPALKGLAAGPVIKVALCFRTAFWEALDRGRYRDATFFQSPGAAFPTFWTALPVRAPLLIAWSGGPSAARFAGIGTPEIVRRALAGLQSLFGERARVESHLTAAHVHDWQQDPFARGAYGYVTVGGDGARDVLAASMKNTLYFAGEATDLEGEAGTVAGALQSGRRAARELMGKL